MILKTVKIPRLLSASDRSVCSCNCFAFFYFNGRILKCTFCMKGELQVNYVLHWNWFCLPASCSSVRVKTTVSGRLTVLCGLHILTDCSGSIPGDATFRGIQYLVVSTATQRTYLCTVWCAVISSQMMHLQANSPCLNVCTCISSVNKGSTRLQTQLTMAFG